MARPLAPPLLLLLLLPACLADVAPGQYLLLHRASGRYLLPDLSLGAGAGADAWDFLPAPAGQFWLRGAASGAFLAARGGQAALAAREGAAAWRALSVCRGSCVLLTEEGGATLVPGEGGVVTLGPGRGLDAAWVLLRPCLAEELAAAPTEDCFPEGSSWAAAREDCCAVEKHGPGGDRRCWDGRYTFERCCLPAGEQVALQSEPASQAALPPRILCSGERMEGEVRYVRLTDAQGDRRWFRTRAVLADTAFDFAGEGTARPALRLLAGAPACGGAELLDRAAALLPGSERHIVEMLRALHEAMVELSEAGSLDLPRDLYYLPFFPQLLITLHRATRDREHLDCLAASAAALAQLPPWRRNAGYDVVLAVGYEKPWEWRAEPGSGLDPDDYNLNAHDPRFANTLTLASNDAFFGDRHVLLQTGSGGAAYRTLRHIVVPLPFTLNCSSFGEAVAARSAPGWAPRFHVAFVGSANGETRGLLAQAYRRLSEELPPAERGRLAFRFAFDDDVRRRLAQRPGETLREWFGDVASFEELLRSSAYCLVMPGDASDLALRFLHALSAGCSPIVVGGPATAIPLPFPGLVDYARFASFATVRDVAEAEALVRRLLLAGGAAPPRLEDVAGLFVHHVDCPFASGAPFAGLLGRSLEERARILGLVRWHN